MTRRALIALAFLVATPSNAMTVLGLKDPIQSDRVVHLDGPIGPELAEKFKRELRLTARRLGDRIVVISSPGGMVEVGNEMIELLEAERRQGVRVVCVVVRGGASSMAFNLLTRCDLRLAVAKSLLLFHPIAITLPCDTERFTSRVLRQLSDDLAKDDEEFRQSNSRALAMSLEEYDGYAERNTLWRAETLLKRGYLHGIVIIGD